MEHKIGEILTLPDGRKAKVVEAKRQLLGCGGCIFWASSECAKHTCHNVLRSDRKSIIYKEIEED